MTTTQLLQEQLTISNLTIGFGLTIQCTFYESDNPNSAQELFLLAYQSEFNGEYEEAIGYYKEIVSDYKDSSSMLLMSCKDIQLFRKEAGNCNGVCTSGEVTFSNSRRHYSLGHHAEIFPKTLQFNQT
jgi:hypothetical protein